MHFLIPVTILRVLNIFLKAIDKRLILILSPLAVIPDFDFFIFYHRATFHNVFFGAFIVFLAVIALKRYFNPWKTAFVGGFFFLMHLILDRGSVIWFYPLTKVGYNFKGNMITLEALQSLPHFSTEFMVLSIIGVIALFSIFFVEILLTQKLKRARKK